MCFLSNCPLKPGRRLGLQLNYSSVDPALTLQGRVVYFNPLPRNHTSYCFRIGIEFMPFTGKRGCNTPDVLEVIMRLEKKYG